MNKNLLFRSIPKVDILLEEQEIQDLIGALFRRGLTRTRDILIRK